MTGPTESRQEIVRGYDALRTSAGCHVVDRDVVSVTGADATDYLQGQCSQDVAALDLVRAPKPCCSAHRARWTPSCASPGLGADEFVVDTDGGFGPAVVARLLRFRLRVKVTVEPLEWSCLAVRGPKAARRGGGGPDGDRAGRVVGSRGCRPARAPSAGWADPVGRRLGRGVRRRGLRGGGSRPESRSTDAELTEGTIAAEVGLVDRTVSFTKGCFTGQELVARLDARGSKVARRLCGVVVLDEDSGRWDRPGSEAVLVGAAVSTADSQHEVGRITSAAWSPRFGRPVALATLHRRVSPPKVCWWPGTAPDAVRSEAAAQARPLPLDG